MTCVPSQTELSARQTRKSNEKYLAEVLTAPQTVLHKQARQKKKFSPLFQKRRRFSSQSVAKEVRLRRLAGTCLSCCSLLTRQMLNVVFFWSGGLPSQPRGVSVKTAPSPPRLKDKETRVHKHLPNVLRRVTRSLRFLGVFITVCFSNLEWAWHGLSSSDAGDRSHRGIMNLNKPSLG